MTQLQAVPLAGRQLLTVGERLKLARERAGLTPSAFARALKMHRNNVSRWEDRFGDPGLPIVRRYVEVCGNTNEQWLLFEVGDWPPLDPGPSERPRQDSNLRPSDHSPERHLAAVA